MKFKYSRRKILPFLSAGFLLPLFGSVKAVENLMEETDQSYQTMLTKDGKIVKVKSNTINKSKIVDKKLSNKSLLSWLKKEDKVI